MGNTILADASENKNQNKSPNIQQHQQQPH
jgi:hypothetical protein